MIDLPMYATLHPSYDTPISMWEKISVKVPWVSEFVNYSQTSKSVTVRTKRRLPVQMSQAGREVLMDCGYPKSRLFMEVFSSTKKRDYWVTNFKLIRTVSLRTPK